MNLTKSLKKRIKFFVPIISLGILLLPATASAITTLSQGYNTTDQLAVGSLVSLVSGTTDNVEAANSNNASSLVGVVINANNSLLSLSSGQQNQVQVATSGLAQVLVSNVNGSISEGDEITASPINGVGMQATSDIKVIGIAQGNLDSSDGSSQTYSDKSGQKHTVLLGEIPVLVNVSYFYKQPNKTLIPSALQNIADSLAGKTVAATPILISMAIFVITIIVVATIVYSMIKSSIISVGRNPLSQSAIYRDILQISALVVGILVVAVVLIYMLLTKT